MSEGERSAIQGVVYPAAGTLGRVPPTISSHSYTAAVPLEVKQHHNADYAGIVDFVANTGNKMCGVAALRTIAGPDVFQTFKDCAALTAGVMLGEMHELCKRMLSAYKQPALLEAARDGQAPLALMLRAFELACLNDESDPSCWKRASVAVAIAENCIGRPLIPSAREVPVPTEMDVRTLTAVARAANQGMRLCSPPPPSRVDTSSDGAPLSPPLTMESGVNPLVTLDDLARCQSRADKPGDRAHLLFRGVKVALGIQVTQSTMYGHVVTILFKGSGSRGSFCVFDSGNLSDDASSYCRPIASEFNSTLYKAMRGLHIQQIIRFSDSPCTSGLTASQPSSVEGATQSHADRSSRIKRAVELISERWGPSVATWMAQGHSEPSDAPTLQGAWLLGPRTYMLGPPQAEEPPPLLHPHDDEGAYSPTTAWKLGPHPRLARWMARELKCIQVQGAHGPPQGLQQSAEASPAGRSPHQPQGARDAPHTPAPSPLTLTVPIPEVDSIPPPLLADGASPCIELRAIPSQPAPQPVSHRTRSRTKATRALRGGGTRTPHLPAVDSQRRRLRGKPAAASNKRHKSLCVHLIAWNTMCRAASNLPVVMGDLQAAVMLRPGDSDDSLRTRSMKLISGSRRGPTSGSRGFCGNRDGVVVALSEPGGEGSLPTLPWGLQCLRHSPPATAPGRNEVALLVSPNLQAKLLSTSTTQCDGRVIIAATVPSLPRPTLLIAAYIPTVFTSTLEAAGEWGGRGTHPTLPHREAVFLQLTSLVTQYARTHEIVLMGDLNTHLGDVGAPGWDRAGWRNLTEHATQYRHADLLRELCSRGNLLPSRLDCTPTRPKHGRAIDFCLLSPALHSATFSASTITAFSCVGTLIGTPLAMSDHHMLHSCTRLSMKRGGKANVGGNDKSPTLRAVPAWSEGTTEGREAWRTLIERARGVAEGWEKDKTDLTAEQVERTLLNLVMKVNSEYKTSTPSRTLLSTVRTLSKKTKSMYSSLVRLEQRLKALTRGVSHPSFTTNKGDINKLESAIETARHEWRLNRRKTSRAIKAHDTFVAKQLASKLHVLNATDPADAHRVIRALTRARRKASRGGFSTARADSGELLEDPQAILSTIHQQMSAIIAPPPTVTDPLGREQLKQRLRCLLPDFLHTIHPQHVTLAHECNCAINSEDVIECALKLHYNKSPGGSLLRSEHIRKTASAFQVALANTMQRIMDGKDPIPPQWNKGVGTLIPKKDSQPGLAPTYRLIVARPPMAKLFYSILARLLQRATAGWASPEQAGFTKSRGTMEHILTLCEGIRCSLNRAVQRHIQWNSQHPPRATPPKDAHLPSLAVIAVFIDFRKAFDTASHTALEIILEAGGVPHALRECVSTYMRQASVSICTDHGTTDPISVTQGYPQGGAMSPLLFKIVMECISWALRLDYLPGEDDPAPGQLSQSGLVISTSHSSIPRLQHLLYADDLVVMCKSPPEAKRAISIIERVASLLGLSINVSKSAFLIMSATCSDTTVAARAITRRNHCHKALKAYSPASGSIKVVDEYTYLGVPIAKTLAHQHHRVEAKARDILGQTVHSHSALARANCIALAPHRRLLQASVTAASDYLLAPFARTSIIGMRDVDHPVAYHCAWSILGMDTQLLHFNYPAALTFIGMVPSYLTAMRARVSFFLTTLRRCNVHTPMWRVLMASIAHCPDTVFTCSNPVPALLDLDMAACTTRHGSDPLTGWRITLAHRCLLELHLLGLTEHIPAIRQIVALWQGDPHPSLPTRTKLRVLAHGLPDPRHRPLRRLSSHTPYLGTSPPHTPRHTPPATLDHSPAHLQGTLRERLRQVGAWLTVARTRATAKYNPHMPHLHTRRPKAYHLGTRGGLPAFLHPIQGSPSPANWACRHDPHLDRAVLIAQTMYFLHPGPHPTYHTKCPLCDTPLTYRASHHLVLDCPRLHGARMRAMARLRDVPAVTHTRDPGDDKSNDPIHKTVPPPAPLLDACRHWHINSNCECMTPRHRTLLLRYILCGQWPQGAPELTGASHVCCTAHTFPHIPNLIVGADTKRGKVITAAVYPAWKAALRECAVFCASMVDAVTSSALQGAPAHPHRMTPTQRHAFHLTNCIHNTRPVVPLPHGTPAPPTPTPPPHSRHAVSHPSPPPGQVMPSPLHVHCGTASSVDEE